MDGLAAGMIDALSSLWIGSEYGTLGHLKNRKITNFHDAASGDNRLQVIVEDTSGDRALYGAKQAGRNRVHRTMEVNEMDACGAKV